MGLMTGIIILSVLVVVHEAGHFLVARFFGVRVLAFSIGFGPVLLKKKIGDTEYRLSAVPFGGYVKMKGQEDIGAPGDSFTADEDDFRSKTVFERASIAIAGPLFNYLLAVAVLWMLFIYGVKEPSLLPAVVGVVADSGAGKKAGVAKGDTLISINGKKITEWNIFLTETMLNTGLKMHLVVGRDGGRSELFITPKGVGRERIGVTGLYQLEPAVVGQVFEKSPAENGGLIAGDTVVSVDGTIVTGWDHFVDIVKNADSLREMSITVKRGDQNKYVSITPEYNGEHKRVMIGIQKAAAMSYNSYTVGSALIKALKRTGNDAVLIGRFLKSLVTARVSVKGMAGPVGIVQLSGMISKEGIVALLLFLAMISVNLAVVNLFPFLIITDGGMIFFLLLEKLRGKALSDKAQDIIQKTAVALIGALLIFTTWNDLTRLFSGGGQ